MAAFREQFASFQPTPESIPPPVVEYRLQRRNKLPVNFHPLNPLSFVLRAGQRAGHAPAIAHPNVPHPVFYTYAVFLQRIQNFAYALIGAGIKPGDVVAVIAPNCPMIAEAHYGIPAARGIICTVNIRLTPPEVAYILSHSQSRFVLVDYELVHLLPPASELAKNGVKVIVSRDTGRAGMGDQYEEFLSGGRRFSGEKSWAGLVWEDDEDTPVSLSYTSGTTGRPKGVITTLRGTYLASVGAVLETELSKDAVYLWVLPMFHVNGWQYPWALVVVAAFQITLRTVSPTLIWEHLLNSGVTHFCSAPTVQITLLSAPEARPLPKPVHTVIGGAAPTAKLIEDMDRVGMRVFHGYGLTETHGPAVKNNPKPHWPSLPLAERAKLIARQGSNITMSDDVRVVKPLNDGESGDVLQEVAHDGKEVGEVVMRGNTVMKEYFRDPEATRQAFRGGYFHSGDLAVMFPDGTLSIQDRSKDIIISGGENASSLAIETALSSHPDVQELTAVARSHWKWGERPMVFVLLTPAGREKWKGKEEGEDGFEGELKRYAKGVLAGFERPEWVKVVDTLPKTSTGKIQKHELRKIAAKL